VPSSALVTSFGRSDDGRHCWPPCTWAPPTDVTASSKDCPPATRSWIVCTVDGSVMVAPT
jgi:hypothetical protein